MFMRTLKLLWTLCNSNCWARKSQSV